MNNGQIRNTILLSAGDEGTYYFSNSSNSIITIGPSNLFNTSSTNGNYYNCILHSGKLTLKTANTGAYNIYGYCIAGLNNKITLTGNNTIPPEGICVLGKWGTYDQDVNGTDQFMIGVGTADNARSNSFATGNDGTNDYIKVGDTKLTEADLIALLATI